MSFFTMWEEKNKTIILIIKLAIKIKNTETDYFKHGILSIEMLPDSGDPP